MIGDCAYQTGIFEILIDNKSHVNDTGYLSFYSILIEDHGGDQPQSV
jgi:hypothetical protein